MLCLCNIWKVLAYYANAYRALPPLREWLEGRTLALDIDTQGPFLTMQ